MSYESIFKAKTGKDFNQFYKTYYPKLVWYIQNIIMDTHEAHDLADEAFIKALNKIEMYDPKYQFSTWLFNIAKKMSLQHLKDNKRMPITSIDKPMGEDGECMSSTLAYVEDTESEHYSKTRMKHKIMIEKIRSLDPKYRMVIEMREIKKMSYQDIADATSTNLSTIKSQLRAGRQLLQQHVAIAFNYIDESY